jgi:ABC-type Fe3+-siderophore transport system permease subunit
MQTEMRSATLGDLQMDKKRRTTALFVMVIAILIQFVMMALIRLLPFGFDHPSSLGLDFGHLIMCGCGYVVALLVGAVASIVARQWPILMLQFVFVGVFCVCLGANS